MNSRTPELLFSSSRKYSSKASTRNKVLISFRTKAWYLIKFLMFYFVDHFFFNLTNLHKRRGNRCDIKFVNCSGQMSSSPMSIDEFVQASVTKNRLWRLVDTVMRRDSIEWRMIYPLDADTVKWNEKQGASITWNRSQRHLQWKLLKIYWAKLDYRFAKDVSKLIEHIQVHEWNV